MGYPRKRRAVVSLITATGVPNAVVCLDPLVCPCSTMSRIDPQHLAWILEGLTEGEVRSYLLHLRDERGVARGTYAPHHAGIQFLYTHTLDRNWSLFSKKESARPSVDACPMFPPMPRRAQSLAA